jgi:hypothetical protein
MVEDVSEEEMRKREFIVFVSLLANSAMQQLGKLANPLTGKTEHNLDAAKATIDMINMLKVKTRGNLSDDEQQVIDATLTRLQLKYVDELKRKDEPARPTDTPDSGMSDGPPEAEA